MSVLARPETRPTSDPSRPVEPRQAFTQQATPLVAETTTQPVAAATGSETHRWFLLLGIPFVLGAAFFGLAVGLGAEWSMVPAFFLGPFLLTATYIALMLTSDTNTTSV
jgi:hypothetical protein